MSTSPKPPPPPSTPAETPTLVATKRLHSEVDHTDADETCLSGHRDNSHSPLKKQCMVASAARLKPITLGVTGYRAWNNQQVFDAAMDDYIDFLRRERRQQVTRIANGDCHLGGVDKMAQDYARRRGIAIANFPATRRTIETYEPSASLSSSSSSPPTQSGIHPDKQPASKDLDTVDTFKYALRRNVIIVQQSNALIAFPHATKSRGTFHTIGVARKRGIDVKVFTVRD